MFELSPVTSLVILFCAMIVLLAAGSPIQYALGGVGLLIIFLLWGPRGLSTVFHSAWAVIDSFTLIAVPMFIFMAHILKSSGIAEDLFRSMRLWFGGMPGGLAIGVVVSCTIIAAMSGVTMTGVVTMGILALPIMLKLGYDKKLATGPILAGGALGVLIPPSVTFIFYGSVTMVSIGKLFLGGIIPGFILSLLYAIYITIRCRFNPMLGPPLPAADRVSLRPKLASLSSLILPAFLIMAVLGTIFLGIASPTEAASTGAAGALICAAIRRRLSWQTVKEATYETFGITVVVMWLMIGAYTFKAAVFGVGGPAVIRDFVMFLGLPPLGVVGLMSLTFLILGCFINEWTVLLITVPVFLPIVLSFGLDPVWFGVFFLVNMQVGYLTPPFGYCLFVLKSVAPPGVSLGDIMRSIVPFVMLQISMVILLIFFPQIALWLPNMFFK